jgi:hypothetical protein
VATTTNHWPTKSALTAGLLRAAVQNLCLHVTHKQKKAAVFFSKPVYRFATGWKRQNGGFILLTRTVMSDPYLLPEIFDCIVNLLHDKPDALRQCCLVSKSWVPRTRKHLFAAVAFPTEKHLGSWKEVFPDPSTSPAHYTKILFVACLQVLTAADAGAGGWIRGFSRVVYLVVHTLPTDGPPSLVPLHGLSPVIKSLRVSVPTLPSSRIINLVRSFPLLEDLRLTVMTPPGISADDDDGSGRLLTATQPSSPPMLTGSLKLSMEGGMEPFIHQLLTLPGGIHFRKVAFKWFHEEDLLMATALVAGCSHALESLDITDFCSTCIQFLPLHQRLTDVPSPAEVSFD